MRMLLLALMAPAAFAQVNVEPITSAATDPGWSFSAGAGAGFASGNTSFLDLTGKTGLTFVTAHPGADEESNAFRDRFIVHGNLARRSYPDGKVLDGRFIHTRYTRMVSLRFGPEVFGQIGNDRLLLQKWRILGGAGVRVVIADTEPADIVFGTGYMFEWEDRNIGEEADDPRIEVDHRSTSFLVVKLFPVKDKLTIQNTVYFQPRWDAPADLQLLNDTRFDIAITDALKWSTSLFLRYDSRPPSELVPLDVRMSNGVTVSF